MAKSSRNKAKKSETKPAPLDDVEAAETADVIETVEDGASDVVAETSLEDGSDNREPNDTDAATADEPDLEMEIVDDPVSSEHADTSESDAVAEPIAKAEPATQSSSGFLPLLLGGVVAGAIGYGVATYYPMNGQSDELTAQLAAQEEQIAALEAQIAQAPEVDLSGIETQLAALGEQTAQQTNALSETVTSSLDALDARLTEVEKRPGSDGTLSDTALAAYQRELEELRADLNAQQETVMSAAAQAEADLAAARAEAEQLEQEALAAAEAAASRAALNRVSTAVETGAPFADALADLGGDLPAELTTAAETGVATTAQLTDDFPAAARAALATARAEGVSGETGGLGGFLRSQFDVRSTAPQEGDGPDAVLSRAEAAIKEGRVSDALAEIEALPEVARAEMTDWTAKATERADVLDAIATLSETYN